MNLPHAALLPPAFTTPTLQEEGSIQHRPPRGTSRVPAFWGVVSSLLCPQTFMLMEFREAINPPRQGSRWWWVFLAEGAQTPATSSRVPGLRAASPVKQQVQHLLGGGEGPVSAQEDGDIGGVIALEG